MVGEKSRLHSRQGVLSVNPGFNSGPRSTRIDSALESETKKITLRPHSSNSGDVLFVLACFSFFMVVASLVGSFIPALVEGNCLMWTFAGANWRVFWTILINGMVAGAGLGAICGLFRTLFYWARQACRTQPYTDYALRMLQAPLFILGAGSGVLVAILTTTRFREAWIWKWPSF